MSDVYAAPQAELNTKEYLELSFSSLGFWRKLFLVFNWLSVVLMGAVLLLVGAEFGFGFLVALVMTLAMAGYCYWIQTAVCNRNMSHLLILTIIQVVPFLNPITALIFFAIRATSKKEWEAHEQ